MKYLNLFCLLIFIPAVLHAQNVERKMIISNGYYYYTTIDPEFQIATLHSGKVSEPLGAGQQKALPAGRNYYEPLNPFSWDVSEKYFYAINSLDHPLNNRNEAIKRFSLSSLQSWEGTGITEMLMQTVDKNTFVMNDPYRFVMDRSNIMNHFFFDGIAMNDSSYFMAIANNGEFSLWNYNGREWKHSPVQDFPVDGYFSLINQKGNIFLLLSTGALYKLSMDGQRVIVKSPGVTGINLSDGMIIENRDTKKNYFLRNSEFNKGTSVDELIAKKAITIF